MTNICVTVKNYNKVSMNLRSFGSNGQHSDRYCLCYEAVHSSDFGSQNSRNTNLS